MSRSNSGAKKGSPAKPEKKLTASQRFWAEVRGYAEALVIAFLVVTFVFNTVGVVGSSMRPTLDGGPGSDQLLQSLLTGDRVFIPKYDNWLRRANILPHYERGTIVVVREPANAPTAQFSTGCSGLRSIFYDCRPFFIKRIIAVPGDHLRIVDGQVYVNDHPIDQSYITASSEIDPDPVDFPVVVAEGGEIVAFRGLSPGTYAGSYLDPQPVPVSNPDVQLYYGNVVDNLAPIPEDAPEGEPFVLDLIVPEGHYFVMGDNRESAEGGSEDSRYFGPVPSITVAGRATAIIWPPRRDGEWNWQVLSPPEAFEAIPDEPSTTPSASVGNND